MEKKFTVTKKQLEEVTIDGWLNTDGIVIFTNRLRESIFLPNDYDWKTDTELLPWAREILEDEQKMLAECYPPEAGYEVTIVPEKPKKRYFIRFDFQNHIGIDAESKEEAQRKGEQLLNDLFRSGQLRVEVSEGADLVVCDTCQKMRAKREILSERSGPEDNYKKITRECWDCAVNDFYS